MSLLIQRFEFLRETPLLKSSYVHQFWCLTKPQLNGWEHERLKNFMILYVHMNVKG